jgi:hypothetical protein
VAAEPNCLLIDDLPAVCFNCAAPLCLRQQVLNLALGEVVELLCLSCLAADNNKSAAEMLTSLMPYVASRECFAKEWARYLTVDFCPNSGGCLPEICFGKG